MCFSVVCASMIWINLWEPNKIFWQHNKHTQETCTALATYSPDRSAVGLVTVHSVSDSVGVWQRNGGRDKAGGAYCGARYQLERCAAPRAPQQARRMPRRHQRGRHHPRGRRRHQRLRRQVLALTLSCVVPSMRRLPSNGPLSLCVSLSNMSLFRMVSVFYARCCSVLLSLAVAGLLIGGGGFRFKTLIIFEKLIFIVFLYQFNGHHIIWITLKKKRRLFI